MFTEAMKDLAWWGNLLSPGKAIERRFMPVDQRIIAMWTDASGLNGLGGYFIAEQSRSTKDIRPTEAFMLAVPRQIQRMQEHINTKEMRAVEQGLLRWAPPWRGSTVSLYIDNQAVIHGIKNQSMRGRTMGALRRCLLRVSRNDLELNPCWIPTQDNLSTDTFSRFN